MTTPSVSEEMIRAREVAASVYGEMHGADALWCERTIAGRNDKTPIVQTALRALAHLPAGSEAVKGGIYGEYTPVSAGVGTAPLISPTGHHEESDPYPRFAAPPSTPRAANVLESGRLAPADAYVIIKRCYDDRTPVMGDAWITKAAREISARSKQAPTVAVGDEGEAVTDTERLNWLQTHPDIGAWLVLSDKPLRIALDLAMSQTDIVKLSAEQGPPIMAALKDWHEDCGDVVWWTWRDGEWLGEPSYIGNPLCDDWPGYHTHWTPHPAFPSSLRARSEQREAPSVVVGEKQKPWFGDERYMPEGHFMARFRPAPTSDGR